MIFGVRSYRVIWFNDVGSCYLKWYWYYTYLMKTFGTKYIVFYLLEFLRCIKWVQEAFPPGGDCSGLVVIYEQCVRTFWHEERYKEDLRYLKVWLEYVCLLHSVAYILCLVYQDCIIYILCHLLMLLLLVL